jgi:hypothetical protein
VKRFFLFSAFFAFSAVKWPFHSPRFPIFRFRAFRFVLQLSAFQRFSVFTLNPMLTTLIDGRRGIRTPIQVNILSPGKDELPGIPDPPQPTLNSPLSTLNCSQPILDFIASDESLDRFDEIICASGWHLDTYRRNPVFQNAHQYGDILFTLGKALITEVRTIPRKAPNNLSTLTPQPSTVLFQRIQFATDVNPIARVAYGLYKGKFLNAVSVGFIPLRWEDAPAAGTNSATGRAGGKVARRQARRKYLEQELLEVSAVGIPANPNALALGLKVGAIEKSDLREILALLKSLCAQPWERRRRAGGFLLEKGKRAGETPALPGLELLLFARQLHGILRRA